MRVAHITALILLCVAGLWVSSLLVKEHLPSSSLPAWFENACGASDEEGISNCQKVAKSQWGTFLGMPVALWGMAYYLGLGLWFLFIGRPSASRRWVHLVPAAAAGAGAAGSAFFIVIMFTKLEQRCVWCMVTHALNFAILILTLLLWPRKAPATGRSEHPSWRLVIGVAVAALLGGAWLWQGVRAAMAAGRLADSEKKFTACETELKRFVASTQSLLLLYQQNPKVEIPVRPDDPMRVPADTKRLLQVIVFSDLECSHCRVFAQALHEKYNPLFDNRLRIIFKHYPQSNLCNPYVKQRFHSNACQAAKAAEAARLQGGSEAFWKAHDALFSAGDAKQLAKFDYRKLASDLGLDPDRFLADMQSQGVSARIAEDIELANKLGITGTPAVFVSERLVPKIAMTQVHFWKALAEWYKAIAGGRAGAATRPADSQPVIEGTPGP